MTMPDIIPFPLRKRKTPRKLPLVWTLVLVINGGAYAVEALRVAGRVIAWQLTKPDGTRYQLASDCSTCDCPDAVFAADRPGGCKHAKAAREMMAMLAPLVTT